MKAIRACVPWSAVSNPTDQEGERAPSHHPGKPLRDDELFLGCLDDSEEGWKWLGSISARWPCSGDFHQAREEKADIGSLEEMPLNGFQVTQGP